MSFIGNQEENVKVGIIEKATLKIQFFPIQAVISPNIAAAPATAKAMGFFIPDDAFDDLFEAGLVLVAVDVAVPATVGVALAGG